MADYREIAKAYLKNGYTLIPVGADKQPTVNWTKFQKRHITEDEINLYFKDCYAVACLTGGPNGLEAVDIDKKYFLRHDLLDALKEKVPVEILQKLYVQKTKNGGFHWVYKTNISMPNSKLASRETTAYERHQTYMEYFNNPLKRDNAAAACFNDKSRVLLETRGGIEENGVKVSKGYFLISPSPGYEHVYGKFNTLTDAERNLLIDTCREFNEVRSKYKNYNKTKLEDKEDNPFLVFNEKGDVLALLFAHGWTEVPGNYGKSVRLRRPGNPDSKSSAMLDLDTRVFNVFSTSTSFDPNTGYTPSDIFIELECGGDAKEAYVKLKELGY